MITKIAPALKPDIAYSIYGNELSSIEDRNLLGSHDGEPRECFHTTLQVGGTFQAMEDSDYGEFHGNNGVRLTVALKELDFPHA